MYLAGPDLTGVGNRIEKVSSSGQILATWEEAGCGPGRLDGLLSIAADGQGNIDVAQVVATDSNPDIGISRACLQQPQTATRPNPPSDDATRRSAPAFAVSLSLR
ncbi:MAG: hypothetical protein NVSMB52_13170 [Chloroflexota bacterium]